MRSEKNLLNRLRTSMLIVAMISVGFISQYSPSSGVAVEQGTWNVPAKVKEMKNPVAANEQSVKRGQELFKVHCAMCHGEKGAGDGPLSAKLKPQPAALSKKILGAQSDGELFWKISEGKPPMPAFKATIKSDKDRWHIVNFLRTL